MKGIGIDTGGTYTDAVLYDSDTREVLAKGKQLTTKEDLSIGIINALSELPRELLGDVELVALSTTLATNACVEGKGGRAKLVLSGTTRDVLERVDAAEKYGFDYDAVLPLQNRGSYNGEFVDMPDWQQILDDNAEFFSDAQALGLAAINSLRNGSAVEKAGGAFFADALKIPVVEASSVATKINVMERGATALLNARLLPVIDEFLEAIDAALADLGISAPLMIMRSDGTLMSVESARVNPVQTILSGPAASVSGSRALASSPRCLVVDMGGTTTDIAIVEEREAVVTDHVRIGGWQTQVEGVYIDTIGLGGDSWVRCDNGKIVLSSRRVLPICVAARRWPRIAGELERLVAKRPIVGMGKHEYFYAVHDIKDPTAYSQGERELVELLVESGPLSVDTHEIRSHEGDIARLEDEGVIMRIGLTPTDAMHIKCEFTGYDVYASRLAARYVLQSFQDMRYLLLGKTDEQVEPLIQKFADDIYELVESKLYHQIVRVCFERSGQLGLPGVDASTIETIADVGWRFRGKINEAAPFRIDLLTGYDFVGVGAPTGIFLPTVASAFGASCFVPPHAEVANALGAVCSEVSARAYAQVTFKRGDNGIVLGYYLYSVENTELFDELEDAQAAALVEVERLAREEAVRRGAIGELDVEVSEKRVAMPVIGSDELQTVSWDYHARARQKR